MGRISWLDEDTDLPNLDEQLHRLEHFTSALADGTIDHDELETQQQAVVAAMKAVESELDDATHAKVTRLLLELTALNVMTVLHELAAERVRATFAEPVEG
jgi:predicted transcriptional regulator